MYGNYLVTDNLLWKIHYCQAPHGYIQSPYDFHFHLGSSLIFLPHKMEYQFLFFGQASYESSKCIAYK